MKSKQRGKKRVNKNKYALLFKERKQIKCRNKICFQSLFSGNQK